MLNNKDFYPTPNHVIRKMLQPFIDNKFEKTRHIGFDSIVEKIKTIRDIKTILEPSAGKGDICDYLTDNLNVRKENIYTIESEPESQTEG